MPHSIVNYPIESYYIQERKTADVYYKLLCRP